MSLPPSKLKWNRARMREHNRMMYRKKHGIPLDAPLSKRGNKRGSRMALDKPRKRRKTFKYYWEKPGFVPPVFSI